jgi:hypothetical protein
MAAKIGLESQFLPALMSAKVRKENAGADREQAKVPVEQARAMRIQGQFQRELQGYTTGPFNG